MVLLIGDDERAHTPTTGGTDHEHVLEAREADDPAVGRLRAGEQVVVHSVFDPPVPAGRGETLARLRTRANVGAAFENIVSSNVGMFSEGFGRRRRR